MFHGSSHECLTKALSLQVPKGLGRELVRFIYVAYVYLPPLKPSHIAYNNTPLKPGMTVSNGEDVHPPV